MQGNILIRRATRDDVPTILRLLADDMLGSKRESVEDVIPESYYTAFEAISSEKNQFLAIVEYEGRAVGTMQITYLPNMSYQGAWRTLIEGVHVDKAFRGRGIGQWMIEWAIAEARKRGCRFVQLTSNKARKDAHRFYERLGFSASHEGFKLDLEK